MTTTQALIEAAAPALARAMSRAGENPEDVALTPARHQSDYRDYDGIGVYARDEATANRALAWVSAWLKARRVSLTYERSADRPDQFGRVWVMALDFETSKRLSDSHPWRGLAAVASYSIGD